MNCEVSTKEAVSEEVPRFYHPPVEVLQAAASEGEVGRGASCTMCVFGGGPAVTNSEKRSSSRDAMSARGSS